MTKLISRTSQLDTRNIDAKKSIAQLDRVVLKNRLIDTNKKSEYSEPDVNKITAFIKNHCRQVRSWKILVELYPYLQ